MDPSNDHLLNIDFTEENMNQAYSSDIGNQAYRQGMPVQYIRTFCLEQVFLPKYEEVEFDLALHALDCLQDLEYTLQAALRDAAERLNITKDNWYEVLENDPGAKSWFKETQIWSGGLEICYAELFIGIRIWV
jgi:hypothetical protein